jgi:hypothetical protein
MKTYYCNCEKYCQGDRRVVSKTTYFVHKKYCDPSLQYTEGFCNYLNWHPVVVPKLGPSRRLAKSSKVADNIGNGSRDDHTTQVLEGVIDHNTVEVSIILH